MHCLGPTKGRKHCRTNHGAHRVQSELCKAAILRELGVLSLLQTSAEPPTARKPKSEDLDLSKC